MSEPVLGERVQFCPLVLEVFSAVSQVVTMGGDGYRGRMSPHTPNEKFEGATVLKTLQVKQLNFFYCIN